MPLMANSRLLSIFEGCAFVTAPCQDGQLNWFWIGRNCIKPSCWKIGICARPSSSPNPLIHCVEKEISMYWDVIEVHPTAPRTLMVRFADGLSGTIHISREFCTGVFQALLEDASVAQAQVENGVVVW